MGVDRNWFFRMQQLQGDIKLHQAILESDRYDEATKQLSRDLIAAETYLLAEAQYNWGVELSGS